MLTPAAHNKRPGGYIREGHCAEGISRAGKVEINWFGPTTTKFVGPKGLLLGIIWAGIAATYGHTLYLTAAERSRSMARRHAGAAPAIIVAL